METKKRVFDENKQNELQNYDLTLGKLEVDRIFVAHHEANDEVIEVSHEEVVKEYSNGGKDLQTVIDTPYQPAQAAWDEYEDIFVFKPYSKGELAVNKERAYKVAIVTKIRARYTIDDELAIIRQREKKTKEWEEYNDYCEECKDEVKIHQVE